MRNARARGAVSTALVGMLMMAGLVRPLLSQKLPTPPAKSPAAAKELTTLLQSRKLQAFAVRDPASPNRFVAVLHVPGTQLLVVAATYEPATDIEIRLYQKDYMGAYGDLNRSALAKSKVFVEDAIANGLKAVPDKEEGTGDSVTIGTERRNFDGDFADPRRRNQKKISQEDYLKAFVAADETYTQLLSVLIDGLKKSAN